MGIACCSQDSARPDVPDETVPGQRAIRGSTHGLGGFRQHSAALLDPTRVIFDLVHKDGTGEIDCDDFISAVKTTKVSMTSEEIEKLFWSIKTKKEGKIDYEEFKDCVSHIESEGGDIFRGLIEQTLSHWLSDYATKYGCHADVPHHYKIPAENAWALLMEGNERYVREDQTAYLLSLMSKVKKLDQMRFSQNPYAIVLCCADSRVQPSLLFETGPGEIFVIRTAGNVVDTSVIASIEYAVEHLGTKLLVVLGHQRCGAVTAAMKYKLPRPSLSDLHKSKRNLHDILSKIHPSCQRAISDLKRNRCTEEEKLDRAIQYNVELAAQYVKQNSPTLEMALEQGKFFIKQATYVLDTGKVQQYVGGLPD